MTYLESSPSAYEHALARLEYGLATSSRRELERALTLARACGADGITTRAQAALRHT